MDTNKKINEEINTIKTKINNLKEVNKINNKTIK